MQRLVIVLVVLWSCSVQAATQTQLRVACPKVIGIGLPFQVQVESDRPMEAVQVEWADTTMTIPAQNATRLEFMLGTDVFKSTTGLTRMRITRLGLAPLSVESIIRVDQRTFPEQRLTVAQKMATPPAEVLERIKQENALVRKILGAITPDAHLELPLIRPVPGVVTSAYGLTRFFNNQPRNPHRGLDLRAALGDPVQAAAPGRVVLAAEHYYAGQCIFLDHGLGVFTLYMHLHKILVQTGDMVEAGQIIGQVGQTGRVTGPHLHFGMTILDLAVDPSPLFFHPRNEH